VTKHCIVLNSFYNQGKAMNKNDDKTQVTVGANGVNLAVGVNINAPFERARPWYTPKAVSWLEDNIPCNCGLKGLEFGGGGSSIWWAARLDILYTVEANPKWSLVLLHHFRNRPDLLLKWRFKFVPANWHHLPDGSLKLKNEWARNPELITDDVMKVIEDDYLDVPSGHFDIVMIDGALRAETVNSVASYVRNKGSLISLIVVDNTESENTSQVCNSVIPKRFRRIDFHEDNPNNMPQHKISTTSIFLDDSLWAKFRLRV
jgi:hypothetical protein